MIDLTPVVQAFVLLISTIITVVVVPYIRQRTSEAQQAQIRALVQTAVYAAEKLYGAGMGVEKHNYVIDMLRHRGYDLDLFEVSTMINAAIQEMEILRDDGVHPVYEEDDDTPQEAEKDISY